MFDTGKMSLPIKIAQVRVPNRVFLAPMSGITDLAFRNIVHRLGAGMVFSEVIASRTFIQQTKETMRRALNDGTKPFAIQISGRDPELMSDCARLAQDLGADVIDINMGCPAKQVTRGLAGSALMRDPDQAGRLIEAVTRISNVPVTLKMRLGWDEHSLNAPEIAYMAENLGVQMITVHGRTRCQFFKGKADWRAISAVKKVISVPLIANGDLSSNEDVVTCLTQSKADGIMIGRAVQGQPWFPGMMARFLATGQPGSPPSISEQGEIVLSHYKALLELYGEHLGLRNARKHLGWYVEKAGLSDEQSASWRQKLCREKNPDKVIALLQRFYEERQVRAAA